MKDIDAKIGASYGKEITGKKLYEFLLDFDILYDKMTDMEKKEFMNTFIEKIELKNETVNNGTGQGSRIEHIDLAFPVYYGDCKGTRIRMPKKTQSKSSVSWKTAEPVRGNETAGEFDKKYDIIEEKV